MDEFTFPTIAAAEQDSVCHHLPFAHFATSPLWLPSSAAVMEASETEKAEAAEEHATVADEEEEKMDLLWENFNEAELHRGSKAAADSTGSEFSDTESETGRQHGCRSMLRAGGASHCRRTSWVLLMRIFKKLFVIEKTISSARTQNR